MPVHKYKQRICQIHKALGIPANYENIYGLPLCPEAAELVEIENDIHGRPQRLTPLAASAWKKMKAQAAKDGIVLEVVSAFRGVDRQQDIIQRKIDAGLDMEAILNVSAAPGYSEHHTGRAVDLTTPGCEPLSELFESTAAFSWLMEHAGAYLFCLSYPKGNSAGISYEPWHWAYRL